MSAVVDTLTLTAEEAVGLVERAEISAAELHAAYRDAIGRHDGELHCYLRTVDEADGPGIPIALKDVISTRGVETTAGSRILSGYVPVFDATVAARCKTAGLTLLGKTNTDEFAMGSSTENSAFGPSHNPWDPTLVPGGSGGGTAAAVSAGLAPWGLGSDTGGSIKQPSALCGNVGLRPTYGTVSRYGVVAFASSLDQVGPVARTVLDAALLHEVIAGHDPCDSTSIDGPVPPVVAAARKADVKGLKIGVVKELGGEGFEPDIIARFEESLDLLRGAGAEIVEVSCPSFVHALAAYYLILPSEASSNLARFDAMRYGLRVLPDGDPSAETVMAASRDAGFGAEVKRRIILGTYALSSGYYDAYYGSAQKVRTLIANDFAAAFGQVDVLASPTSPTTAFKFGDKLDNPLAMYAQDVATIPANLAGVPGISLPSGVAGDGLPTGIQFLAPAMADERLYNVGAALERMLLDQWGSPILSKIGGAA
jgi:aspartyl-tRNA(Asn)/glutamyl-tRNA(Gln) amidotransferase subunit A